jgi:predicted TIM-barrel fold metal-dependent hydrolase
MSPTRIIDSHHHIWLKKDVPWLAEEPRPRIFGPYEAIRRDYPVEEYIADHGKFNVVKSVYVQCNWDPKRSIDETAWLQSVADRSGFPHGIVAYIDLSADDVEAKLDAQIAFRNVCGVRQQIHWHQNPNWAYVEDPVLFDSPKWRDGLRRVAERGLPFDLQIFPSQMKPIRGMLDAFGDLPFILNHAGMPEDRSPAGWKIWSDGIKELGQHKNLYVKFSGLNTFEHRCSADLMRPVVQESLASFGTDRCMFGSNFPIEKMWTSYETYVSDMIMAIGPVSQADLDQIFYNTAASVYQLK